MFDKEGETLFFVCRKKNGQFTGISPFKKEEKGTALIDQA